MDTLVQICECNILDVIKLFSNKSSTTRGNNNGGIEKRITENGIDSHCRIMKLSCTREQKISGKF